METVYDFIGKTYTNQSEKEMKNWMETNTQHKHGQHQYSSANYGLSDEIIKRDFKDYINTYIN